MTMNADNDEARLHSIHLRILGLTGITMHEEADGVPKQMRAVVAAARDSVSHGFSGPSRRLVKAPRNEQYIAIWTSDNPNIEFETAIEPQLRRSLHRNFELVVGITSSRKKQPIPIGAASLPLQQAVALRSRDTDKIVLDLPVFNLASLKGNPFQTNTKSAKEFSSSSVPPHKTGGLFRSRSLRHQRSGTTAGSGSVATLSPSWKSPSEAIVPQTPCPYQMDPSRDAAILRIELEVKELAPERSRGIVLVQPRLNANGSENSVEVALTGANVQHKQYRVKIVDETTMDCELAPVKQKACLDPSEEDSPTPTLASSSGEMSSVENNLYVWPSGAVERVLSDEVSGRLDEASRVNNEEKVRKDNDTSLKNRDMGIEAPIGGAVESISRKPSFFRMLPRIRSKSAPHTTTHPAGLETPLPLKTPRYVPPNACTTEKATPRPAFADILEEGQTDRPLSSKLPTVGEGQTAAPETFQPTPVQYSPKHLTDNMQFSFPMNIMNAPPPSKKKGKKDLVPMGTILQAPKEGTRVEPIEDEKDTQGFASSMQQRLRGIFLSKEEEEEVSENEEETAEESYRRPAIQDDIVDLVAAFGEICRPMNTSALDDSITEGPAWIFDEDNDVSGDEDDDSTFDDDSNYSNDLFGELHSGEGTEVDVTQAVPLRQSSRVFRRNRSLKTKIRTPVKQALPVTSPKEPERVLPPPKQLVSVLKNGPAKSPLRILPQIDEPNSGSPNCVSQLPPVKPSRLNPLSMAQNFVDYVTKAITPSGPEDKEESFPVPSVFLEGRDMVSVGELTATSHEMQIDMHEFKKLIEDHLEHARDNQKEYVDGDGIDMFHMTEDEDSTKEDQIIPMADTGSWEDFMAL